jgi:hypothetical protein
MSDKRSTVCREIPDSNLRNPNTTDPNQSRILTDLKSRGSFTITSNPLLQTSSAIPRPEGRGSFTSTYTNSSTFFRNPPAGRPGIFHVNLHRQLHTFFRNPPAGRPGIFHVNLHQHCHTFSATPGPKAADGPAN